MGKHGTVPKVEKHTLSRVFVYGDGFRYWPSDLPWRLTCRENMALSHEKKDFGGLKEVP